MKPDGVTSWEETGAENVAGSHGSLEREDPGSSIYGDVSGYQVPSSYKP